MAEAKKPSGGKRIIDVAHPDATAPSGNSKSVIVTSRPLLQDPMMVTEEEPAATTAKAAKPGKPAGATEAKPAKSTPELKIEPPPEKIAEEPETESAPAAEEASVAEKDENNGDAAVAEPADKAQADAEAETKRQAHIDELADSKKYYLPIDTIENRRSRRFVAVGILLSLVLIVAWADVALDAGLIHLGNVKPVTHFFSN